MSDSPVNRKQLVLIGILITSLALLARPYLTGHSRSLPANRVVSSPERRAPQTFAPVAPVPNQPAEQRAPAGSDDSLSEIERLLR